VRKQSVGQSILEVKCPQGVVCESRVLLHWSRSRQDVCCIGAVLIVITAAIAYWISVVAADDGTALNCRGISVACMKEVAFFYGGCLPQELGHVLGSPVEMPASQLRVELTIQEMGDCLGA
jgi:hypothetical protein